MRTFLLCITLIWNVLFLVDTPAANLNQWEDLQPSGSQNALGGPVTTGVLLSDGRAIVRPASSDNYVRSAAGQPWMKTSWDIGGEPGRRIFSPVAHPSAPDIVTARTVYVGGRPAIVRSYDGGQSWTVMLDFPPPNVMRVAAFGVAPSDSDIIYVRVDDAGLYKTTDGGTSWSLVNATVSNRIAEIKVDPADSDTLYALDTLRVVKSSDGGQSFTSVSNGITVEEDYFSNIAVDNSNAGVVYLASGGDAAIWKTLDGGNSWVRIQMPPMSSGSQIESVVVDPTDSDIVYVVATGGGGFTNVVSVSRDAGQTWTPLENQTTIGGAARNVLVGADGGVLVVGDHGVATLAGDTLVNANAGLNELRLKHLRLVAGDSQRLYVSDPRSGVATTNPQLPFWELRNDGIPHEALNLVVDPNDPEHLHIINLQGLFESNDGGRNWNRMPAPTNTGPLGLGISTVNRQVIHIIDYVSPLTSTDGGLSWIRGDIDESFVAVQSEGEIVTSFSDAATAFAGTFDGVYATYDTGQTWVRLEAPFADDRIYDIEFDPRTAGRVYVATADTVWRSDDNGASWTSVTAGASFGGAIYAISLDPVVDGRVFVSPLSSHIWALDPRTQQWSVILIRPSGAVSAGAALVADSANSGRLYHVTKALQRVQLDSDLDGVADNIDNCILMANANQIDSDADGIGNQCDADIAPAENDCVVNVLDLGVLRLAYFSVPGDPNWNPAADLNGDGAVNVVDLGILRNAFFERPGYSSLATACH